MSRWATTRADAGFTLVELLVAITIMGVVASSITSVVLSTFRVEQHQSTLQDVIDDGRISMQRLRRELRAARRIHEDSGPRNLRFWVDQDQDQIPTADEEICYRVEPIGASGSQWQIVRRTQAVDPANCAPIPIDVGDPDDFVAPAGGSVQPVARTLVEANPFVRYDPVPGGPTDPPTREVFIELVLEVVGERNLGQTTVEGAVRLRNVP
jgi:prepilin-type N-terminal cleavage/methylation domain-containing protein